MTTTKTRDKNMATIMQRWATAKQRLTLAVPRVIEAIREAREIVRDACGQRIFRVHTHGLSLDENEDGMTAASRRHKFYFTPDGKYRDAIGNGSRAIADQHFAMLISEFEAYVDALDSVQTGDIIAAWERQEEAE